MGFETLSRNLGQKCGTDRDTHTQTHTQDHVQSCSATKNLSFANFYNSTKHSLMSFQFAPSFQTPNHTISSSLGSNQKLNKTRTQNKNLFISLRPTFTFLNAAYTYSHSLIKGFQHSISVCTIKTLTAGQFWKNSSEKKDIS